MKYNNIFYLVFVIALAASCYGINAESKTKKDAVQNKGFAVIELFTSEGCSSCPPADELITKILNEHKEDVYILSYHVDYWNRLGWKDEFSKAIFSERQKQYARSFALEGVYTPQIVVNGSEQFTGSERRLRLSLTKNRQAQSGLAVAIEKSNFSAVKLTYTNTGNKPVQLNIVLIQPEAYTDVRRGENSGRKLHHVNIVRELKTIETIAGSGSIDIELPKELANTPLQLLAFTQQKNDMKITGVMQVSL